MTRRSRTRVKNRRNRRAAIRRIAFENLEARRVLTTLTIFGSLGSDTFRLAADGTGFIFTRNSNSPLSFAGPFDDVDFFGLEGDDTLTLDFSNGPLQADISFNGGDQFSTAPGDQLVLEGGNVNSVDYVFSSADSGSLVVDSGVISTSITYSGLEPITDNLGAIDRTLTFNGGDETIDITDDATPNNNISTVDSTVGELLNFVHPTSTLTINGGSGDDVFNLTSLDGSSDIPTIVLNGDAADDEFNIEVVPSGSALTLSGDDGNDSFLLGGTIQNVSSLAGAITVNGGSEFSSPTITDSVTANGTTVSQTVIAGDNLSVLDQSDTGVSFYDFSSTTLSVGALAATSFSNVESFNILTTSGNSTVNVSDTPSYSYLGIQSQSGSDIIGILQTGSESVVQVTTQGGDDEINVLDTGSDSVLTVKTGDGNDSYTQFDSGSGSGVSVEGQNDSDTLTFEDVGASSVTFAGGDDGEDDFFLESSASGSQQQFEGGAGDDLFEFGSTFMSLGNLLGQTVVDGGANLSSTVSSVITAKGVDSILTQLIGDEIKLSDETNLADATYSLSNTAFNLNGVLAQISYQSVEGIYLDGGQGNNTFNISDTELDSYTHITSQDGDDDINVTSIGTRSYLEVSSAGGEDEFNITTTGVRSNTKLIGGDDNDVFTVGATAQESGLQLDGQNGEDVFDVQNSSLFSVLLAQGGNDADEFLIKSLFQSTVQLNGDADNDKFSFGNAFSGLRGITANIQVVGGTNDPTPTITESVTAEGNTVTQTLAIGDELKFLDQPSFDAATYNLSAMMFDRDTVAATMFSEIETIDIDAGSGANTFNVSNTPDSTTTLFDSQGDADDVNITTTGNNSILKVNTGGGEDDVDIDGTGAASVTKIITGLNHDTVTHDFNGVGSGVSVVGSGGEDTMTFNGASLFSSVVLSGGSDNDTFHVLAEPAGSLAVAGGTPNPASASGDTLFVDGNTKDLDFTASQITYGGSNPFAIFTLEDVTADNFDNTTIDVFNTNNSGYGSLRSAIKLANKAVGNATIKFAILGTGPHEIEVNSVLPVITGGTAVQILGETQPGYVDQPLIGIDGGPAGPGVDGLRIQGPNVLVSALAIHGFGSDGIDISGGLGHAFVANWIGLNTDGVPDGNQTGLRINNSPFNVVLANTISGNNGTGVIVQEPTGTSFFENNNIGTTPDGTGPAGNGGNGVLVQSPGNVFLNNTISANAAVGISVTPTADNTTLQGNRVGTNQAGDAPLPNGSFGAFLRSDGNIIEPDIFAGGNVFAGNVRHGLVLSGSDNNIITGSFFGTNDLGNSTIGNQGYGIYLVNSDNNIMGGMTAGTENVVSANDQSGIVLANSDGNTIQNNKVGVDLAGTVDLGNTGNGIFLQNGASGNKIAGNQIAGNGSSGISILGPTTELNSIESNLIGTNNTGTATIPSGPFGILVSAPNNTIGGDMGKSNTVGGSTRGIVFSGVNATGNTVSYNTINTDASGSADLGLTTGIQFAKDANGNTVGPANLIAKTDTGIRFLGNSGNENQITQNSITDNSIIGIDLAGLGPTANDATDVDEGANRTQNFPELQTAEIIGSNLRVSYSIPTDPANAAFFLTMELFKADPTGQGETHLGDLFYNTADATTGIVTKTLIGGATGLLSGDFVVATATDAAGNTSEFSMPVTVGGPVAAALAPSSSPLDVNVDGRISAVDALQVINLINTPAEAEQGSVQFVRGDTNGDGRVTAADALKIVNWINNQSHYDPERDAAQLAEIVDQVLSTDDDDWKDDIIGLF